MSLMGGFVQLYNICEAYFIKIALIAFLRIKIHSQNINLQILSDTEVMIHNT